MLRVYEVQLFRLEMEYYSMHMAAVTSLTLPQSIEPILIQFLRCMKHMSGMTSRILTFKCLIVCGLLV